MPGAAMELQIQTAGNRAFPRDVRIWPEFCRSDLDDLPPGERTRQKPRLLCAGNRLHADAACEPVRDAESYLTIARHHAT